MGLPGVPPKNEREATAALAAEIVESVTKDEEGPLALPDIAREKSSKQIAMLKAWWADTDQKVFRIAQDLVDTRLALDVAVARLLKYEPEVAKRLGQVDIPTQEELDAIATLPST